MSPTAEAGATTHLQGPGTARWSPCEAPPCGSAAVRCGRAWTFASAPSEFTAVLGPNGVGKSTMVKVLLGTLPAAAGEVRVLGARPGQANNRIGYLPQRRSFDASLRIRGEDVVRMGLDGDRWGCRCRSRARVGGPTAHAWTR
ncbi:ATP-binding cassette domain-containing protein [Streptomyces lasalocidi]